MFSVVAHGDTEGAGLLRRAIIDWLATLQLIPLDALERYIGCYAPYANNHEALEQDQALQREVSPLATRLAVAVAHVRRGAAPPITRPSSP